MTYNGWYAMTPPKKKQQKKTPKNKTKLFLIKSQDLDHGYN